MKALTPYERQIVADTFKNYSEAPEEYRACKLALLIAEFEGEKS